MKHVKQLSRTPGRAVDIPVDVKVDFIVALLQAFEPILSAKQPSR